MKKYLNILSVFLIVLVCFLTLTGCKSAVKVKDDGGDMLIQTTEERGIHLSRRNVKNDDGSYTLQALVMPADATNKKLTWSLECDDENFSDAYDLENYVKLTVSSDTLSCNVLKLAPCPVQLKIVVTSQANSSVSATCTVDFFKKINSINISSLEIRTRSIDDYNESDEWLYVLTRDNGKILENGNFDCSFISYEDLFNYEACLNYITIEPTYTVGTITPNLSFNFQIRLSLELTDSFDSNGITEYLSDFFTIGDINGLSPTFKSFFDSSCDITNSEILTIVKNTSTLFTLNIKCEQIYNNEVVGSFDDMVDFINFNLNTVSVTSVDLDESNIIL